MPMVAYFEELSPAADRRRSARRALHLGAQAGGGAEVATIHDLSLTGALIETSVPMLVGSTFEVDSVGVFRPSLEVAQQLPVSSDIWVKTTRRQLQAKADKIERELDPFCSTSPLAVLHPARV